MVPWWCNFVVMPKFTKNGARVTIWLKRPAYRALSELAKARDTSRTKVVRNLILAASAEASAPKGKNEN